ncbi:lysophospholipid acyltransferase family protein [Oryzibacter oryziterrae]|uniref:lysophospholipid acyltransferase family protein n=1 Tax=Oryzibacter oryziterrae TaxID=2766474 RepID=UPI001F43FFCF|nr:lysophospholipid acyltransferase family protein [Oryzibacter oryziterrae]
MLVRSLLYSVYFFVGTLVLMILLSPAMLFGRSGAMAAARLWARIIMGGHQVITGIRHEFRNFDRLPKGGAILAIKHQSTWETIALMPHIGDPAFILKRELTWIPLFGWWLAAARMIPVNRGKGASAMKQMTEEARARVNAGQKVVLFPEGTRRPAGAEPAYKSGIAFLYGELKVPVVPIALNSGTCWPRKALVHRRGTIVAEVLAPIPPGLGLKEMLKRLQADLEAGCDRLILEAAARGDDLPPSALARVDALKAPSA